jgi:hypothetical protein
MGEKIEITSDLFTRVAEQLKHETVEIGSKDRTENYEKEAEKIKKISTKESKPRVLIKEKPVLKKKLIPIKSLIRLLKIYLNLLLRIRNYQLLKQRKLRNMNLRLILEKKLKSIMKKKINF